mgnify:CR=1 FL=1
MEKVERGKMRATTDNEFYEFYVDYPPTYNEYGKQLVERDLDNALSCIFRSIYGSRTLLPEVPGLFIDIERYTHILDTIDNRLAVNTIVNDTIFRICGELNPEVTVEYDTISQMLTYNISMRGKFLLKVEQADSLDTAEITTMTKKFYD